MRDLEIAKHKLKTENLSLVIVRAGKILFESNLRGVAGLIRAIDDLGPRLSSASVADKVVGRAAALLLAYSHIGEVYAGIISNDGLAALLEYGVKAEYGRLVPKIMNQQGRDLCPLEKLSTTINSPSEAYKKIKEFLFSEEHKNNIR